MKRQINIISIILMIFFIGITSCSKKLDNWSYPTSTISGQFLYDSQPLQIMGTASDVDGTNMLQLNQTGPGNWDPGYIKMFAEQDASYTIKTFDGDYYLVITPGKGPWLPNKDTLRFTLKGEKKGMNFNVTPYFWMSDFTSTYKDSVFTANFNLQKIVPAAVLDNVVIDLGVTTIVDKTSKVYEISFNTLTTGANTISLDLRTLTAAQKTSLAKTGFLYARVGVKATAAADLLYSKTVQLQ